jgi:hypothetical protein
MSGDLATVQPAAPVPVNDGDPIISMIERAARDPSVDIDKFERLMTMKERVDKQNALRAFNDAVAQAKGEFGTIVKNRVVDFTSQKGRTNYRHEDFSAVANVVDPVLKRHGLAYRFRSTQNGQRLTVTCILSHAHGHSEETTLDVAEDHSGNKNSIQAIGSAATYLQRYTLKLALGLASSHDDDGRRASEPQGFITDDQQAAIRKLCDDTGTDLGQFLTFANADNLGEIAARDYQRLHGLLTKKKMQKEAGK